MRRVSGTLAARPGRHRLRHRRPAVCTYRKTGSMPARQAPGPIDTSIERAQAMLGFVRCRCHPWPLQDQAGSSSRSGTRSSKGCIPADRRQREADLLHGAIVLAYDDRQRTAEGSKIHCLGTGHLPAFAVRHGAERTRRLDFRFPIGCCGNSSRIRLGVGPARDPSMLSAFGNNPGQAMIFRKPVRRRHCVTPHGRGDACCQDHRAKLHSGVPAASVRKCIC